MDRGPSGRESSTHGQRGLALKNMGGETTEAWRAVLDDLVDRGEALSKYKDSNSLDAALIARAQVIEHFEIACYGTLISWAEQLGYDQAVALLEESLAEEEDLDETLTEMAEGKSNLEAEKDETKPRKTRAASRQ
jgi:ferritin-like metal-binding protein YciE